MSRVFLYYLTKALKSGKNTLILVRVTLILAMVKTTCNLQLYYLECLVHKLSLVSIPSRLWHTWLQKPSSLTW